MDLKDFTEKEQEQIKKGLSTAVLTDKEAAKKILALVPEEWIKTIPFLLPFSTGHLKRPFSLPTVSYFSKNTKRHARIHAWHCHYLILCLFIFC